VFPERRKLILVRHRNHRCNNFACQAEAPFRPDDRGDGKGASVTIYVNTKILAALIGATSAIAALMFARPAMADPPLPDPAIPVAAPAGSVPALQVPAPVPAPTPSPDGTVHGATNELPAPPDGVPHLSSPENLPPGTTDTPPDGGQPRKLGYLRDLWHAVQTQEVSGKDALLFLAQRPLNANAAPPPGMSANPTPPQPPEPAPAAPAPAPQP
jgi:resuscitation-promoting factor RpfA